MSIRTKELKLSYELLVSILSYDPITGIFIWRIRPANNVLAGRVAGSKSTQGYIKITINKESYFAHRLAWLYVYKKWPSKSIDHINQNKEDNSIKNLRDVDAVINGHNKKIDIRNSSKTTGVHYNKKDNKWMAKITIKGKTIHLGSFNTAEDASKVRLKAKKEFIAKLS